MEHLFNNLLLSPSTLRGLADSEQYRSQMSAGQGSSNDENHSPTLDDDVFKEASELSSAWIQNKEPEE